MNEPPTPIDDQDEHGFWKSPDTAFLLTGLAACGAAAFTSGGLAVLAVGIALACLAGSVAVSVLPRESPCERSIRECEDAPAVAAASEPAIAQGSETGHSHHWRESVAASRGGGRKR